MATFKLNVNGQVRTVEVDPDTPLMWVLRDHIGLTGTKFGCGIAQCGSCTVHLDGMAMRSCNLPVSMVGNRSVTTIEGFAASGESKALLDAWREHDVPQCGYCQAGQIMNAASLLKGNPNPSDEEIETAMHGNLCRCGTYNRIKAAIKTAIQHL